MKKSNRCLSIVLLILMLGTLFPTAIFANSAEPPGITVIVSNPPDDLSLSIRFSDDTQTDAVLLVKEQKAWEAYYKFFYGMSPSRNNDFEGAVLIVRSSEKNFHCTLPASTFGKYNNLLTLDLKNESVKVGQTAFRVSLLVFMRVVLTLFIEGLIFLFFCYRKKASWISFLIINLITQGGLNALFTGPNLGTYWMFGFIFSEIVIIVAEAIAFASTVKEFKKSKAILYTVFANLFSMIAGGLIISYLPV